MVAWHHWLNGHEFEQAPGVGDGQGSLVCYSPRGHKESDMTKQLNWTELKYLDHSVICFSWMPPVLTEKVTLTRNPVKSLISKQIVHSKWKSIGKKSFRNWLSLEIICSMSRHCLDSSSDSVGVRLSKWLQQAWYQDTNRASVWRDIGDSFLWYISSPWICRDPWASLVAQMVKHLSAMLETRVWSLGGEDPLEKEMAAHSSTLAWKIPRTEEPGRQATVCGVAKSRIWLSDFTSLYGCAHHRTHSDGLKNGIHSGLSPGSSMLGCSLFPWQGRLWLPGSSLTRYGSPLDLQTSTVATHYRQRNLQSLT